MKKWVIYEWFQTELAIFHIKKMRFVEKEMATHSSILAWKSPWTEKPGRLQSMRSQRVEHDLATKQQRYRPPG